MSDTRSFKELARSAAEELGRIKDTLRVKAHLGGMDAEEAFNAVAAQVQKISDEMVDAAEKGLGEIKGYSDDGARLQAHLGVMDARDRWEKLHPYLVKIAQEVQETGKASLDALGIDKAKVQAHLAQMDAEDAIRERTEKARAAIKAAGDGATEIAKDFVADLKSALDEIKDRLDNAR